MNSWNTESSSADVFNVGSEGLVAAGLFICGENKHADVIKGLQGLNAT